MRGAAEGIVQRHQMLRLPRERALMIYPLEVWNAIYNARSITRQPPTSPNTAPATQNECNDWACSQMKRHLQCAEQQAAASHLTKYCACPAKWMSWLIVLTYEASFTMGGATGISLWILRLPRKMKVMIEPAHIWNVIYNARRNRQHPHTSPNTALPRKMNVMIDRAHIWDVIHNARSDRHRPAASPNTARATQNCTPKS